MEIVGEIYDDVYGYYIFVNIVEEFLVIYSCIGVDGIKIVLGVVDIVFGCGDNWGVGIYLSSDDVILIINL